MLSRALGTRLLYRDGRLSSTEVECGPRSSRCPNSSTPSSQVDRLLKERNHQRRREGQAKPEEQVVHNGGAQEEQLLRAARSQDAEPHDGEHPEGGQCGGSQTEQDARPPAWTPVRHSRCDTEQEG